MMLHKFEVLKRPYLSAKKFFNVVHLLLQDFSTGYSLSFIVSKCHYLFLLEYIRCKKVGFPISIEVLSESF